MCPFLLPRRDTATSFLRIYSSVHRSSDVTDVVRLELRCFLVDHALLDLELRHRLHELDECLNLLVLHLGLVEEVKLQEDRVLSVLEQVVVAILAEHAGDGLCSQSLDEVILESQVNRRRELLVVRILLQVLKMLFGDEIVVS